ncbi:MAG: CRISPR-associated protein Cas4 [Lentisphaeria bacterium]|nr:CRISPR-associated protein Cas4 [Lentisphaeria bacterium]
MGEYPEDEAIPLSAIQHFAFCERQCYLIHAEQQWSENYATLSGRFAHERVDLEKTSYTADGIRQVRSLPLFSRRYGLSGRADLVEFDDRHGKVYPVEYKLGAPKSGDCDAVQLCAQAFCLEEMLGVQIPDGAVYYHRIRRREFFALSAELRTDTEERIRRTHLLLRRELPPAAVWDKKHCENCSLRECCFPRLKNLPTPETYLRQRLREEDLL